MTDSDSDYDENDKLELFSDDEEAKSKAYKEKFEKYFSKYQNNTKEPLEFFQMVKNYLVDFKEEKKKK